MCHLSQGNMLRLLIVGKWLAEYKRDTWFLFINGLIITLNVNGFNAPTKRYRITEWIQKQEPYIYCPQETRFTPRDKYRLKGNEWKKIFHLNGNQKKASVAILISHKGDFKMTNIIRDVEGHYMIIKGSIQEEDITIGNIYAPNIEKPQYTRQAVTCIRGQFNSNTVIVGDFNTPLTPMDRSSRQRIQ